MNRRSASHSAAGIVARGCLMGAADIVPGVSGGTMALITGIYSRLLEALGHIPEAVLVLIRERRPLEAFRRMDGGFLLLLLAGVAVSVIGLAHGIGYLLTHHELLVRAFFFGLVLGASVHVGRQVPRWSRVALAALIAGTLCAWGLGLTTPVAPTLTLPLAFGAGFVAISAMILPGISGSFLLLLLGVYEPVLAAVRTLDLPVLAAFSLGCATGLVLMARAVAAMLRRFPGATLAMLTGFMLGSLAHLWPWRVLSEAETTYHNLAPLNYAQSTGEAHQLAVALPALVCGVLVVVVLERYAGGRLADQ